MEVVYRKKHILTLPYWLIPEKVQDKLGLFRLDTAANIYPSTVSKNQSHLYRMSAELKRTVSVSFLQQAVDHIIPRFPTIAARLCTGFFWYRLKPVKSLTVQEDPDRLCARMTRREMRKSCLRIMTKGNEIAVEYFHGLCDGAAAMTFLKSLTAEYIRLAENIYIPNIDGVCSPSEKVHPGELTDAFETYASKVKKDRSAGKALSLAGKALPHEEQISTEAYLAVTDVKEEARRYGVTITEYLTARLLYAIQQIWEEEKHRPSGHLRVSVPVNLRQFFPTETLRNFSHFIMIDIDPRKGHWTFEEICSSVHHQMGLQLTRKEMMAEISNNVTILRNPVFRLIPLGIKNLMMRLSYWIFGTNTSCLSISNLGAVAVPDEMKPFVARFHMQLDAHKGGPYSCAVVSFGDELTVSMTRSIQDDRLERYFLGRLYDPF